jgi:hypothetical protein
MAGWAKVLGRMTLWGGGKWRTQMLKKKGSVQAKCFFLCSLISSLGLNGVGHWTSSSLNVFVKSMVG